MTSRDELRRATVRSMIEYLVARVTDGSWLGYARAWLDGSLVAGRHVDYVFDRPATVRDFLTDRLVASCHAAQLMKERADEMIYERARLLEDAAWAVMFVEDGNGSQAEGALDRIRAALRKGVVLHD